VGPLYGCMRDRSHTLAAGPQPPAPQLAGVTASPVGAGCSPPLLRTPSLHARATLASLAFPHTHLASMNAFPRIVWLLWLQGWSEAPWLARQVRRSYEKFASAYDLRLLDAANVSVYMNVSYLQHPSLSAAARSDVIRVHLLARYGGLWADSSLLALLPLEEWLPSAVAPAGFWSYHSGDSDRPCSWVLAAVEGSYVMAAWRAQVDAFWEARLARTEVERWGGALTQLLRGRGAKVPYFWLDGLFALLLLQNGTARALWDRAPRHDCEAPYDAASVHGRYWSSVDPVWAEQVALHPPWLLKLSHAKAPALPPLADVAVAGKLAGNCSTTWAVHIATKALRPGMRSTG